MTDLPAPQILLIASYMLMFSLCFLGLQILRARLRRRHRQDGMGALPMALGLAFSAPSLAGAAFLAIDGIGFVAMSATITGVVSLGVLGDLVWRWHTGRSLSENEELDVISQDL